MATQTATSPTAVTGIVMKKAGPPVPPRPQHTTTTAGLLKSQRESVMNAMNRAAATTATHLPTGSANSRVSIGNTIEHSQASLPYPVIQKKSTVATPVVGRTVVYKSPSVHLPKKKEEELQQQQQQLTANAVSSTVKATKPVGTNVPRPPLKLRKAPDVPTAQKPKSEPKEELKTEAIVEYGGGDENRNKVELRHNLDTPTNQLPIKFPHENGNNIVILQSSNGVNLSRHHSMGSPKNNSTTLKETRLSLGRADFQRVSIGGKIQLDQLQPAQPLPRPRKIVKVPVATLDIEDTDPTITTPPTSSSSSNTVGSIFRRSKTTLDNLASRANITTISTVNSSNSFLSGKTAGIKNNLRNAAERLFSEIIVNQQRHITDSPIIVTKHERAVQHQALLEQELTQERERRMASSVAVTVMSNESANNCTRININATTPTKPAGGNNAASGVLSPTKSVKIENILSSPEKKTAFHEILISELAAMRARSSSMENLQTKDLSQSSNRPPSKSQIPTKITAATVAQASNNDNNINKNYNISSNVNDNNINGDNSSRERRNSIEDHDPDTEDVDADNVEDVEGDDDEGSKTSKISASNSPRKRFPSGCSSDSSPYGTERSARIRTSDWIEVGDNGKEVTMTSCHISLEDSGLEDEERIDEMSSSGVGDSWDSVKEAENVNRCRNVKRIMSITDLPPLPKSLSGINKMLGSDSGLISDADGNTENNNINNSNNSNKKSNNKLDYQKDDTNNNNSNTNKKTHETDELMAATTGRGENETRETKAVTATLRAAIAAATTTKATATAGSTLDTQLAILRKEMYGLRQLDLSLLSQLWALNDSIQEFRTMLEEQDQEQDPESYSPHSPTPSSYDSVSSDGEDDTATNHNARKSTEATPKVITTQPKLKKSNSTAKAVEAHLKKTTSTPINTANVQQLPSVKPSLPKPLDVKPVPRMRSAPPPPPVNRKAAAPPRPT